MNNYHFIAFDLDGTLLDDEMKLPGKTIRQISKLIETGVHCAIISARCVNDIRKFTANMPFAYLAGLNGAQIFNNQCRQYEYSCFLKPEIAAGIIDYLKSQKILAQIFTADQVYLTGYSSNPFTYQYQLSLNPHLIDELTGYQTVFSIQIVGETEKKAASIEQFLSRQYSEQLSIEDNGFFYIQVVNRGVNKGTALQYIVRQLDLQIENTIAIGDSPADLAMLEKAGLAIAMSNGHPALLKSVRTVTEKDCSHNGALDYLMKNCFHSLQ